MDNYFLDFRGYWRNLDRDAIPHLPGVFCVYRGKWDLGARKFLPIELLFVGESPNVQHALRRHADRPNWEARLQAGEELGYSYAPIIVGRPQAAAALIFRHKPTDNSRQHKYLFAYPPTAVTLFGRHACLDMSFCVPDEAAVLELAQPSLRAA